MKHKITLGVLLLSTLGLSAQGIAVDQSFGNNGMVIVPFTGDPNAHSSVIDLTPDNQLAIITAFLQSMQVNQFAKKYSLSGDLTFTGQAFDSAFAEQRSIKILEDGRFLIAKNNLICYHQDGTPDLSFGINGSVPLNGDLLNDIQVSKDNRIILAGHNFQGNKGGFVRVLDMNGQPDTTFGDHGRFGFLFNHYEFIFQIREQTDGKFVLAGCSYRPDLPSLHTLIRILPNGQPDPAFGVNGSVLDSLTGSGENYSLAIQPDNKILVCGDAFDGSESGIVVRYLPDGTRDNSFGQNGILSLPMFFEASDLLVLPDGKILVYGLATNTDASHTIMVRLLPNGMLDPFFGNGGTFYSIAGDCDRPLRMKLVQGNKIITIEGVNTSFNALRLRKFILDLNVGVVAPGDKPSLWVYPNPVHESFDIGFTLNTPQTLQIDLYDRQGKLIRNALAATSFESGEHKEAVQLPAGLPGGNYLLTLSSAGKPVATVQIMKQ